MNRLAKISGFIILIAINIVFCGCEKHPPEPWIDTFNHEGVTFKIATKVGSTSRNLNGTITYTTGEGTVLIWDLKTLIVNGKNYGKLEIHQIVEIDINGQIRIIEAANSGRVPATTKR